MKVAVPYAVIVLLVSFLAHFSPNFPGTSGVSGRLSFRPSYLAAILWPLVLGALMGFVGGFRSGGEDVRRSGEPWTRRLRGAIAGGWAMLLVGLLAAYVAVLLLGLVQPEARPFGTNIDTEGGASSLASSSILTVLTVPNRGALVLFPSMGSCLTASIRSSGFGFSFCFLSYQHFLPSSQGLARLGQANPLTGTTPSLPAAPVGYYAFLLVPLVAVLFGGMVAARRARAESRAEAAGVGALAGVAFGLLALVTVVLASLTVRASAGGLGAAPLGGSGTASASAGPDIVSSVLLALLWGAAGGALGGLFQGRSLPARPMPVVTPAPGSSESAFGFGAPERPPEPPPEPPPPPGPPWRPRDPDQGPGPPPPG
jgi:hypothetical protein